MRILILLLALTSCSPIPDLRSIRSQHPSSFGELYDAKGELLHETRRNYTVDRRSWIPLAEVPVEIQRELVQLEDKRFYQHPGVDPVALAAALKSWPHRGASTISMQLAKLLRPHSRTIGGKLGQMGRALMLEAKLTKAEILEAWINLLPLKGDIQGLHAGAMALFNKHPRALTQEERVLLYALLPSPNTKAPALLARACRNLRRLGKADCSGLEKTYLASHVPKPRIELLESLAPHLARRLLKKEEVVRTSVRRELQSLAVRTLMGHLQDLRHKNVQDGAILILDRRSGEVLTYVGSSGPHSASPQVDHVQSYRQAGSTLKPFLYGAAIEKRLITARTLLLDSPFTITREGLTYQPENYQKSFTHKEVPAKVALGSSLNIPAIRVIDLLTPEAFHQVLQRVGFTHLRDEAFYGHSMALGAVDVTLWDLVHAYRELAENRAFSPETSFIVSTILAEKENRHLTFGLQSSLTTSTWTAVKTGTSKDMRDNWCVGYTDAYVIGVWVGNSSGDPMWNVSGITGAAPIFNHLVSYLHQARASVSPEPPPALVKSGEDFFLPGTEPKSEATLLPRNHVSKIIFPQQGTQFAYDPEIPEAHQRVRFEISSTEGMLHLNGVELSPKELSDGFLPMKKGKYRLELWESGELRDEVSFFVKAGRTRR